MVQRNSNIQFFYKNSTSTHIMPCHAYLGRRERILSEKNQIRVIATTVSE